MTEQTKDKRPQAKFEKLFDTEITDAEWNAVKFMAKSIEEDKGWKIFNDLLALAEKTS